MSNATRLLFMLIAFAATASGVYFLAPSQHPSAAPPTFKQAASSNSQDACSLITQSDITTVQGVQVQGAQPSRHKQGDLVIEQCYYTAVSTDGRDNLSVYLQLIQPGATGARAAALKEFWKDRFERDREEERERENEEENEEGEERIDDPVRVSGIGEQAFWLGTSRGGALYVLTKDRVLRLTVGGRDVTSQREKSKLLARKALRRLA
jgi:hypothetical protein